MDEKLNPHLDLEIKLEIPELKEEPEDCNTEYNYAIDEGQVKQETLQDIDNGVIKVEEKKSNNIDPLPSLGRGKKITAVKVSTNVKSPTSIDDKYSSGVPSVSGCGLQLGLHSELDIKFEPEEDLNEDPLAFDETADHYGTPPFSDHKLQMIGTFEAQHTKRHNVNGIHRASKLITKNADSQSHKASHACEKCGKKFKQIDHLKAHIRRDTCGKTYTCEICDKTFAVKDYLAKHKITHTDYRPYACALCNKRFRESGNLKRHTRIHTGDKPYSCEICGKKFSRNGILKLHIQSHTGIKPYVCDICNTRFTTKTNLVIHNKRKHIGDRS